MGYPVIMAANKGHFPFRQVDDFDLHELIYEGPHTLVYLGRQETLDRPVIIKLLKPQVKSRKEWIDRFRREARVCARLKHPHIVDVYTLGEKKNYHYIVMELVEGLSLKDILQEAGSLPPEVSFSIAEQLLQALHLVHQHRIVHRDVKPANILIDWEGRARLTDFGLAQIADEPGVTQQGSMIGTPSYMAPEQVQGSDIDGRSDLFALGAVMYEMLSGEQAFAGENYSTSLYKIMNEDPPPVSQLQTNFLEEIDSHLQKYLAKRREQRWNDAGQARENLQLLVKRMGLELRSERVKDTVHQLRTAHGKNRKQIPEGSESMQSPGSTSRLRPVRKWKLLGGVVGAILLLFLLTLIPLSKESNPGENGHKGSPQSNAGKVSGDSIRNSNSQPDSGQSNDLAAEAQFTAGKGASSPIPENPAVKKPVPNKKTGEAIQNKAVVNETSSAVKTDSPARLEISAEPWAKIEIDGRVIEPRTTEKVIDVDPGPHTLTFSHPSFSSHITEIDLKPGEQHVLHWSFLKNAAHLWVEARPWAEVYVDNQFHDSTPLAKPIILSPGKHFLELKHPQLPPYREFVNLLPGDTLRLQITLKAK